MIHMVEYFQKAISSNWRIEHNSAVRERYTRKQGIDIYKDDKFKDILAYIIYAFYSTLITMAYMFPILDHA